MPDREAGSWGENDDRRWRIGGDAEIVWIRDNTEICRSITSAIPAVFEAYAIVEPPGTGEHDPHSWLEGPDRHDAAVLAVLCEHTAVQAVVAWLLEHRRVRT